MANVDHYHDNADDNTEIAVKQSKDDIKPSSPHVGRNGTVTFRPYTEDLHSLNAQPPKKRFRYDEEESPLVATNGTAEASHLAAAAGRSTTVEDLYPELLCLLFSYLDEEAKGRAAQVCRKWRDAAYSKSAWRGATARLHLENSSPVVFACLAKRGIAQVQVLSLRHSLTDLVSGLPNLTHLDLSDSMLQSAFPPTTTTSHLQSINLSNCKRLTNEGLAAVAAACPQLESLDLGGCSRLTNEGLRALAALPCARGNLHRLSLRSCYQITDTGVGHLVGLTTKTTINSDESEAEKSAKIGGLLALEDLSLQDCQKLTDAALCLLQEEGSSCRRTLRRLNLSFCAGITDGGLRSLGRLGALEALCLRACDNIGDRGLAHLAEASVRLNSLDVSFCAVSDTGLAHIAGGLFSLRQLAVVGCCRITDEGLCRVAKTLLDLDTLSVGQCVRLSDRSLEAMAAHLRHLRRLDLYGCPRISAAGVAGLRAAGLPRLTSLNLSLLND